MTRSAELPPVRACLFDMDGLLIDSENIYTHIINKILHEFQRPTLPWSIKVQLRGRPRPESTNILLQWAKLPIPTNEYLAKQAALEEQFLPNSQPLPGVRSLLKNLLSTQSTERPVSICLGTSSTHRNYQLKTSHLQDVFSAFPLSQRVLGDDCRIGKGRGKPNPDIYLLALETVNQNLRRCGECEIKPSECLVFEDGVPGVEAARRAGMRVVWVPDPGLLESYKGRELQVLAGKILDDVSGNTVIGIEPHKSVEEIMLSTGAGKPSIISDGWGDLLITIEDFPYERYGIHPRY